MTYSLSNIYTDQMTYSLSNIYTDQTRANDVLLTVEDDDPSISPTRLGVVTETHVVAFHAGRLAMATQVQVVATETGITRLHPGKLWNRERNANQSTDLNFKSNFICVALV
jgi:hypothetical protein